MSSEHVHNQTDSASTPEPVKAGGGAGDPILGAITELESRFSGLKKLHEQAVQREKDLDQRQAILAELERTLKERSQSLDARDGELSEQGARLAETERALAQAREAATQERAEAERARMAAQEQARAAADREAALGVRERELSQREQSALAAKKAADELVGAVEARERGIAEREHVAVEQDKRLAERERQLGESEKRITSTEFNMASQRQALQQQVEAFAQRERALAERESRMGAAEQAIEEQKRRFAEQMLRVSEREEKQDANERALAETAAELEQSRAAFAEQTAGISERERAIAEEQASLEKLQEAFAARDAELKRLEQVFAERTQGLAEQERVSTERRRSVEQSEQRLEAARKKLAEQEEALSELEAGVREREQELGVERQAILHSQQESQARQSQAAEELATTREQLNSLRGELDAREKKIRDSESVVKAKIAEIQRQADKVERDRVAVAEQAKTLAAQSGDSHGAAIYAGRQEQIQIQLGEANAKAAAAGVELAQARKELARLTEELRETAAKSLRAEDEARAEVTRREHSISAMEKELAELRQAQASASERLVRAEERASSSVNPADLAERDRQIEELRQSIEEMSSVNTTLKKRLEEATRTGRDEGAAAAAAEEIARRDEAIVLLKEKLDEVSARCGELEEQVEAGGGGGLIEAASSIDAADPRVRHRRERLKQYKGMLQSQARKIVQAQNALQKRHHDCEQILQQRAKLAALAADLTRRQKQVESAKARSGAAAVMLYVTAAVAIMAVLSWQAARQIWPGTYVASATIEADTHGRTPTDTELATWKQYHEELLTNPSLIDVAAQRMQQRGLVQMGDAAELAAKLRHDLYYQSEAPGTITVELKNQGADKARMILDTYVTALKSVSDAGRDQRPDDLGLNIAKAATAASDPLVASYIEHAGAILGGAVVALGMFAVVVWGRLSKAKQKFEHAQAVEAALNEVNWAAMEASMKKGPLQSPSADTKGRKAKE